MSNMLISTLVTLFTVVVLSLVSYMKLEPKWIDEVKFSWRTTLLVAASSGFVVGLGSSILVGGFDYRVLAMTTLAWMAGVVFVTDYSNYSIPRGVSYFALLPAFISLVWAYIDTGNNGILITFGMAMILPLLFFFASGLGMGDVRLFVLTAIVTPWWFTFTGWAWGLLLASFFGVISFILARVLKRGALVEHKTGKLANMIDDTKELKVKKKRAVPFGPPILAGYILVGLFLLATWGETMPTDPLLQSPWV